VIFQQISVLIGLEYSRKLAHVKGFASRLSFLQAPLDTAGASG
jgi:hypothetical protein